MVRWDYYFHTHGTSCVLDTLLCSTRQVSTVSRCKVSKASQLQSSPKSKIYEVFFYVQMNSKYAGPDLATSLKQFVFIHLVMTPSGLPGVYYVMKKLGMTFGLPGPQW